MEGKDEKKPGNATPAAVAAALAVLGLSVGVDVPELFAASPQDRIESKQDKISPIIQGEESKQIDATKGARQGKVESFLHKQNPAQNELPAVQGKVKGSPQQKIDLSQGKIDAQQKKAQGMPK